MSMPAPADSSARATWSAEAARIALRARSILVSPGTEWQVIDREPENEATLYRRYIAPMVVAAALATAIGFRLFGYRTFFFAPGFRFSTELALRNFVASALLACIGVYLLSLVVDALAPTFGGTPHPVQALKVVAYATTPAWIGGLLGLVPALAPLSFLVGLYAAYLYYTGLPVLMRAPRSRALGYAGAVFVIGFVVGLLMQQIGKKVIHMP